MQNKSYKNIKKQRLYNKSLWHSKQNFFLKAIRRIYFSSLLSVFQITVHKSYRKNAESISICQFDRRNFCERQSNALDRSASNAPNIVLLSTANLHFSSIVRRHCCVLQPFLKPHCRLDKCTSIYSFIWRNMQYPRHIWQDTN